MYTLSFRVVKESGYVREDHTSSHVSENGESLSLIVCGISDPKGKALGGRFLDERAAP